MTGEAIQAGTARDLIPCSIEVSYNAKGEASFSVKTYYAPHKELEALDRTAIAIIHAASLWRPDLLEAAQSHHDAWAASWSAWAPQVKQG